MPTVQSVSDMRRDVQMIFKHTPYEKQVMMFSATLSKEVRPVCRKFTQHVITNFNGRPGTESSSFHLATGRCNRRNHNFVFRDDNIFRDDYIFRDEYWEPEILIHHCKARDWKAWGNRTGSWKLAPEYRILRVA